MDLHPGVHFPAVTAADFVAGLSRWGSIQLGVTESPAGQLVFPGRNVPDMVLISHLFWEAKKVVLLTPAHCPSVCVSASLTQLPAPSLPPGLAPLYPQGHLCQEASQKPCLGRVQASVN